MASSVCDNKVLRLVDTITSTPSGPWSISRPEVHWDASSSYCGRWTRLAASLPSQSARQGG